MCCTSSLRYSTSAVSCCTLAPSPLSLWSRNASSSYSTRSRYSLFSLLSLRLPAVQLLLIGVLLCLLSPSLLLLSLFSLLCAVDLYLHPRSACQALGCLY